jgi:hypothetical protein
MIQANELRIGNYIQSSLLPTKHKVVGFMNRNNKTDLYTDLQQAYSDCEDWEPIPVTEDILLKCGFIHQPQYDYWRIYALQKDFIIMHGGDKNTWVLCDIDITVMISSLHQLQNLYFALMGEELNISYNE